MEVIEWLQHKDHWQLEELSTHLCREYDVEFKSRQSYYDLFTQAGLSWKKTQKRNPKHDAQAVAAQKKSPSQFLQQHQQDVDLGKVRVLMLDECHLLWGDLCGYVWGKTNERIEVDMTN
jgi:putative transposase